MTNDELPIAVFDFETDPFLFGRVPAPFVAQVKYEDGRRFTFWGADCVASLLEHFKSNTVPTIYYAHNGGKFDFSFFVLHLENPLMIINGRIGKAKIGIHEVRDSFLLFPMPLSAYQKGSIDYEKFEAGEREKHKAEILEYLDKDCDYLLDLVSAFTREYGLGLTMPGTAIKQVREFRRQKLGSESNDDRFRPFYFGGRVECFESGIVTSTRGFKVYDVNSMYPYVMKRHRHPWKLEYKQLTNARIDTEGWIVGAPGIPYFAELDAESWGALPLRDETKKVTFPHGRNTFFACSHEVTAGVQLGLITRAHAKRVWLCSKTQDFSEFVDHFIEQKLAAERQKDKVARTLAKLILNSAYGKFGQNPRDFKEWHLQVLGRDARPKGIEWEIYERGEQLVIWRRPTPNWKFFDVAIAASVTSAARAELLRALQGATRPVYCDTDSIICEALDAELDDTALGAWKTEAEGDRIAIAGKKLYALFAGETPVKHACKGIKINPREILRVAQGEVIEWSSEAPTFSLTGSATFLRRAAKQTA